MARNVGRLSARTVETRTKPGYYSDGGGLYLKVSGDAVLSGMWWKMP